jgi:hypothetical protein
MGYVPGRPIKLWLKVRNVNASEQDFTASWSVFDEGGNKIDALSWSGVLTTDPGVTTWRLTRTLPADLTTGPYTYTASVMSHEQTTSAAVVFYVADSVAMSDDFSDDQSGWSTNQTANYSVGYLAGEYRIWITAAGRLVRVTPGLNLTDSVLEVEARNAGSVLGDYGLLFALSDDSQSFYIFLVSSNGKYAIFEHTPGGWETIQTWTASPWLSTGQGLNRIMSVHHQGQISVYANGAHLVTLPDDTLTGGRVGLVAQSSDEAGVDVRFDNFSAYRLSTTSRNAPGTSSNRSTESGLSCAHPEP